MKKTFTSLFATLFVLILTASANNSKLTISSNMQQTIRVLIDGKTYHLNARSSNAEIVLQELRPGTRNIKIYKESVGYTNGRTGRNNNRNSQLIYNGNVFIKSGYHTDVLINRFGKAFIDERYVNSSDYYDDTYVDNNWNETAMSSTAFNQLKQSIKRESFDDTRLRIAKSAINNNRWLTVIQVKELMQLFSFDNNKLELAKYCYGFTTDRYQYYTVADALVFNNSKTTLLDFIEQQRN